MQIEREILQVSDKKSAARPYAITQKIVNPISGGLFSSFKKRGGGFFARVTKARDMP